MTKRIHYSTYKTIGAMQFVNEVRGSYDKETKTIEVKINDNVWNLMVQATADPETIKAIYREMYAGNAAALEKVEALTAEQIEQGKAINRQGLQKMGYTMDKVIALVNA